MILFFLILFNAHTLPGYPCTDTCNITIRYFRASGELGGNNEAFDFERSTSGTWKCRYIVYKKNTYGLTTDSATIELFYKRNQNDNEIVKEFKLTSNQYNYLKHLVIYFKNVKLQKNLYSNAGEHYYITINGKNLYINDKGGQLKKYVEMRKIFLSNKD